MGIVSFIVLYIGIRLVDKFIDDNLPNLHYKNILKAIPAIFIIAYIFLTAWKNSLFKIPATKEYIAFLAAIVIAIKWAELKGKIERPDGLTRI